VTDRIADIACCATCRNCWRSSGTARRHPRAAALPANQDHAGRTAGAGGRRSAHL